MFYNVYWYLNHLFDHFFNNNLFTCRNSIFVVLKWYFEMVKTTFVYNKIYISKFIFILYYYIRIIEYTRLFSRFSCI